ncbi:MAG: DUF202 domain-containing protein [Marmoricola sp.]
MTSVPTPGQPVRQGTAAQRTRLSWSRTILTLAAGGLTIARLLWPHSTALGVSVLVASLGIAVTLVGLSALHDHAIAKEGARDPDGVLLAVVAAGTCVLGGAAIALVALG